MAAQPSIISQDDSPQAVGYAGDKQMAWIAFLDHLANSPRDPEFMTHRPMNRIPVERDLFPDE